LDGSTVALVAGSYICGSIQIGVAVARLTGGSDPRTVGSGRTGATNALRAMGRGPAAVVVAGDALKGAIPVLVANWLGVGPAVEVLCAMAAVVGATWSIFLRFRGGRSVVTNAGAMLAIQPVAVLAAAPVFIGTVLATRYVSLGSLLGTLAIAVATWLLWAAANGLISGAYPLYATAAAAVVWLAHADNIDRLIHGTERKFDLGLLVGRSQ
jgi:glycerol-3-phosphate acyltransferase PlsY